MEIHPEYVGGGDGKPLRIGGYVAQSSIRVTILNIDRAGPVIDASLSKQASSVSSLEFSSSKQDDARRQALEMAVALARADADAMARAAGGAIGGLLELTAQPSYVAPIAVGFAQARSLSTQAAMPISPGIIRVSATVSARWSFVSRR